jgi:hypothetical protein
VELHKSVFDAGMEVILLHERAILADIRVIADCSAASTVTRCCPGTRLRICVPVLGATMFLIRPHAGA